MKRSIIMFLLLLAIIQKQLYAETHVSGNQTGTWTKANSPYILDGDVTIEFSEVLTIESGVEVKMPNSAFNFLVHGKLIAVGTINDSIKYSGNQMGKIILFSDSQNSEFEYCSFNKIGKPFYPSYNYGAIEASTSSLAVKNSFFSNSPCSAILILNKATPQIENNNFSNNAYNIVCFIYSTKGLKNNNSIITILQTILSQDFILPKGEYKLIGGIEVNNGFTLQLERGSIFYSTSFDSYYGSSDFLIYGTLLADASNGEPIQFIKPISTSNGSILLSTTSTNSIFRNIKIESWAMTVSNSTAVIENVQFSNCVTALSCLSSTNISNCCFKNNIVAVSTAYSFKRVTLKNCSFENNSNAIFDNVNGINDSTDARNCWWGDPTGPRTVNNPGGTGASISSRVIFMPFLVSAINCDAILPLNLKSFSIILKNNITNLSWQTATEINTKSFTIQRSADSRDFTTIGTVPAKGNNSSYNYTDNLPMQGTNYYRLLITDKNGSITYSEIRSINFSNNITARIYPNPVKEKLTIELNSAIAGKANITITSAEGKTIHQLTTLLQSGNNKITILVAGLVSGTYLLRINTSEGQQVMKFVKQ